MQLDQEDMKGLEVDGTIPDRYRGSAGEQIDWFRIEKKAYMLMYDSRSERYGDARKEAGAAGKL